MNFNTIKILINCTFHQGPFEHKPTLESVSGQVYEEVSVSYGENTMKQKKLVMGKPLDNKVVRLPNVIVNPSAVT